MSRGTSRTEAEARKAGDITRVFDSCDKWWDHCEGARVDGTGNQAEDMGRGDNNWTLGHSRSECLKLARYGWPDGSARIAKQSAKLSRVIGLAIKVPTLTWDVSGDEPDVAAFLAGEPECMVSLQPEDGPLRVMRLSVAFCASAGVSAEVLARRGATVAALVDALERCNIRVEIVMGCTTDCGGKDYTAVITVKKAQEPMNIDRMAYVLVHPGMLRRHWFRALERENDDDCKRATNQGYGHVEDIPNRFRGEIHLGPMDLRDDTWNDDGKAVAWALKTLEAQGVKLEQEAA